MSEDVEMGVVESEIRAVEVEGIGLTLTTTLSNLRTLFKLRDQFQVGSHSIIISKDNVLVCLQTLNISIKILSQP